MTDLPIRVVIAEDSAVLRDGWRSPPVDRGFVITDAVSGPREALRISVERDLPDVAIVDIRMPPMFTDEGLRAALDLRRVHKGLGILLFSQYIETRYAAELPADDAAGIGYLLKDRVADVSDFCSYGVVMCGVRWHRSTPRSSPSFSEPPAGLLRPEA